MGIINDPDGPGAFMDEGDEGALAIANLSKNKTLLALKLTEESPAEPQLVSGIKNLKDAFKHFQPNSEVEFDGTNETKVEETLNFNSLSDFGAKGIIKQSDLLSGLSQRRETLRALKARIAASAKLQKLLNDEAAKQSFIEVLKSMVAELEAADKN